MSQELRVGSLCTGYGGLDVAVHNVFGGELAWWSDIEAGPIAVMKRHTDAPNVGDVKNVDWASAAPIDILTAGYPCQPFSNAGKREGINDPRHIWPWIAEAIGILRPRYVVLENVAAHLRRGFDVVTSDLADLGYDARWTVVRASDIGAPHQRRRLYVVAQDPNQQPRIEWRKPAPGQAQGGRPRADVGGRSGVASTDPDGDGCERIPERHGKPAIAEADHARRRVDDVGRFLGWGPYGGAITRWERISGRLAPAPTETGARGGQVLAPAFVEWMMGLHEGHVTHTPGLTRNSQLKLLGNGVVPQQAEHAIHLLTGDMNVARRG